MVYLRSHRVAYDFPGFPGPMHVSSGAGWHVTSDMNCTAVDNVLPDLDMDAPGAMCSFTVQRDYMSAIVTFIGPLSLSIFTVWMSFVAPYGAAMPRVAVSALAFVGMGASLNKLADKLPATGFCWTFH